MIIKLLLIASALVALAWLVRSQPSSRRLVITRGTALAVTVAWIAAVINPDIPQYLAEAVGVTRGTDLLLYALVVTFTFTAVGWSQRVRHLDERISELTRSLAIANRRLDDIESGADVGGSRSTAPRADVAQVRARG